MIPTFAARGLLAAVPPDPPDPPGPTLSANMVRLQRLLLQDLLQQHQLQQQRTQPSVKRTLNTSHMQCHVMLTLAIQPSGFSEK